MSVDARKLSDRTCASSIRAALAMWVFCGIGLFQLPAQAVEPVSDIRAYNHQGIQKLIALDVLRASAVVNGQARLVVGSKFFATNSKSQTRLAVLAHNYLRSRNLPFNSLVLIDGRTGRTVATYDPAQGLRRM